MIEERTRILAQTIKKLYHRGAKFNIQKVFLKTHIADIASAISTFESDEMYELFRLVYSDESRADLLSYLEEDVQKDLFNHMPDEERVRLVKLMESDDLADLLGHLNEDISKDILNKMDQEDSEEVSDLMGYPEDTAGGIMSSDCFVMEQNHTVDQTIQAIQAENDINTVLFYIYVVDENEHLIGVLSLKQLLLSSKEQVLREIMIPDVISVRVDLDKEEVAKSVERYDFLSIPVVDETNKLVGVITVDDVIDVIREEAEEDLMAMGQAGVDSSASTLEHFKARWPWLAFAYLGGVLCFYVVKTLLGESSFSKGSLASSVGFVPLILTLGATASNQAATTMITALRLGNFQTSSPYQHIGKELLLGLFLGLSFALMTVLLGPLLFGSGFVSLLTLAVVVQILLSILMGAGIPIIIDKVGMNPVVAAVPIITVLADILSMLLIFGFMFGGAV